MSWVLVCGCVGVAVMLLVELVVLHRRVNELPLATWGVMKKERARDHDEALAALHDAAERKVSSLSSGIQRLHDKLGAELRAESADAELRARLLERRAQDTMLALDQAAELVVTLRELAAGARPATILPPEPANVAAGLTRPSATWRPHAPPKKTLLGIRPPPLPVAYEGDRPSEEELTQVVDRPRPEQLGTAKTLMSMQAVAPPKKKEERS